MPFKDKPAFRCVACGHLEGPEAAGVRSTPSMCSSCRSGVTFKPDGTKEYHPENWQVLSQLTAKELKSIGLKPDEVTAPHGSGADTNEMHRIENLNRVKETHANLTAKKANWEKSKDTAVSKVHALEDQISDLQGKVDSYPGEPFDPELTEFVENIEKLKQQVQEIKNTEWTERDEDHLTEVSKTVRNKGVVTHRNPSSVFVGAREKVKSKDKA